MLEYIYSLQLTMFNAREEIDQVELTGLSADAEPEWKNPPWMPGTKLKAARRRAVTK